MKNAPKTRRATDEPPPVLGSCSHCGLDFTSRYQAKRHFCQKGSTHGPR